MFVSDQYYPEFLKSALSRQPCERLIVSPRRQILIEGPLLLLDAGKPTEMFVILFDDLLIIARKKKALSKKVNESSMSSYTYEGEIVQTIYSLSSSFPILQLCCHLQ